MAQETEFELIFRNATIVDGTGGPAIEGDVAVRDGVLAQVGGHVDGRAAEEVDGRDLVLAPGFIDPHTHLDANLFWDPDLTPSSSFGVTTVVTANCGYALAPVLSEEARQYLVAAMSTVEQIPEVSIETGVPFDWSDLASYAARLDGARRAAQSRLPDRPRADPGRRARRARRVLAAGDRRRDRRDGPPPAPGHRPRRARASRPTRWSATRARAGPPCPGRSAARTSSWRWPPCSGRAPDRACSPWPTPRSCKGREERIADLGWHQRLAAASGRPVVVGPIFDSTEDPGGAFVLMDLALAGQRADRHVVPQISTRPFELWTRLDSPGTLVRSLPSLMAAVQDAGAAGVRALAADPEARAQLRREGAVMPPNPVFNGRWDHVRVRYSHQPGVEGKDLAALSAERGIDPIDLLLDLALADNFETQVATVMRNGDDDEVARLVAHPAAMIGASDAGAHVLANTDSCYAVWTLQHWVRERRVLSLERAVAMLTGDQARLLGFADRGLVRPGLAADLVLFDPDRIATTRVRFVDDQPAGGRRLVTDAQGVEMSVVNGVVATRQGVSTGARSGRRLRPVA